MNWKTLRNIKFELCISSKKILIGSIVDVVLRSMVSYEDSVGRRSSDRFYFNYFSMSYFVFRVIEDKSIDFLWNSQVCCFEKELKEESITTATEAWVCNINTCHKMTIVYISDWKSEDFDANWNNSSYNYFVHPKIPNPKLLLMNLAFSSYHCSGKW